MVLRLAAVSLVAALALAGCGSSSDEGADTPQAAATVTETALPSDAAGELSSGAASGSSSAQPGDGASAGASGSSAAATTGTTGTPQSASAAPTAPSGPIGLDTTVHDNGLGHTIEFEEAVRSFPAPKSSQALVDQGDELVLVKVRVTAGEKYYVTVGQDDFVFGVEGSQYPGMSMATDDIKKAMRRAGYPPLADVDAGQTGEGWVAGFVRPAGSPQAYVGYRRLAYHVSGGGSIPAKTWKVTLPLG